MAKVIFTASVSSTYDDLPERRYHFPKTYLNQVEQAVGDWAIYYEPRRDKGLSSSGGRQSYFATARIDRIDTDASRPEHYYAWVSNYLEFDHSIPFKTDSHYYESRLRKANGQTNKGLFGRSVRQLPDLDYHAILQAGFGHSLGRTARERPGVDIPEDAPPPLPFTIQEDPATYDIQPRHMVEQLVKRPFRDRAFASVVKSAYADTCAFTGIKLINGGGRSEVQAAHIKPVADAGPDSPRNGLALSGTMHWMFDRGLLSISDDYHILKAQKAIPNTVLQLLPKDNRIYLPKNQILRPHIEFLRYHREQIFKG